MPHHRNSDITCTGDRKGIAHGVPDRPRDVSMIKDILMALDTLTVI